MLILPTFVFKIFSFNLDHWSEFSLLIDTWNYIFLVKWHQCGNSLSVCVFDLTGDLSKERSLSHRVFRVHGKHALSAYEGNE